jgi:hypothetical protein
MLHCVNAERTGAAVQFRRMKEWRRTSVKDRPIRQAIVVAATASLPLGETNPAPAEDEIDLMLQRGQIPADMINRHGYSDFTDPLGRFLDLLAAGAFVEARSIQPDACATWLATRQNSPLTGKFWVWNTEIDLDTLCAHRYQSGRAR